MDTLWEFLTESQNTIYLSSAVLFVLLVGTQLLGFVPDFDMGELDLDVGELGEYDVDVTVDVDVSPDIESTAGDITKCPTVILITAFLFLFSFVGFVLSYFINSLEYELSATQRFVGTLVLSFALSFSLSKRLGLLFASLFPDVASYEMKDLVGSLGVVRSGMLSSSRLGLVDVRDENGGAVKIQASLLEGEQDVLKGSQVRVLKKHGHRYYCTSKV